MGMRNNGNESDMIVTVNKVALLTILRDNRTKHLAEFQEACVVYRRRVSEEVSLQMTALLKYQHAFASASWEGLPVFPSIGLHKLPQPQNFVKSYDRAIGMLELHANETMTIDMATYQRFVEDDWEWSAQAKIANSGYLGRPTLGA